MVRSYDVTGISWGGTTSDGDEHAVSFIVLSVAPGEMYACSINNGSSVKIIPVNATTYGMFIQILPTSLKMYAHYIISEKETKHLILRNLVKNVILFLRTGKFAEFVVAVYKDFVAIIWNQTSAPGRHLLGIPTWN